MSNENTEGKTIYNLELHECLSVSDDCIVGVMRVPGGWIYEVNFTSSSGVENTNHVFVPEDKIEITGTKIP